jgi:hypothetical protein
MTAGVLVRPVDVAFVGRGLWFGLVALSAVWMATVAPWHVDWVGRDLSRYLAADYGAGFLYSPAFAVLVSPLRPLPFEVTVALWRIGEVAALALAVRGTVWGWAVFLIPGFWWSELVGCNVMGYATAAMIAVIRWPSVRSVSLYAVMVALIPKPAFLPVVVWGFVVVPAARRYVLAIGAAGLAMLAWPGYLNAILYGHEGWMANLRWPQPWGYLAAAAVTLVGLRFPRLLGVAALLASPYVFPYHTTVLGTLFTRPGSAGSTSESR